jgi:hypothetical protein
MYASYNKRSVGKCDQFTRHEVISLFGCNRGFIPWLLAFSMTKTQGEPFSWHLEIPSALRSPKAEYPDANSIVIDIKPGNKEGLYLCELTDVWGYSSAGWTPMMWRMKQLLWAADSKKIDRLDFKAPSDGHEIHSFIHAAGSVRRGEIVGTWNPPNASPTNSALLWPDALDYFVGEMNSRKLSRAS